MTIALVCAALLIEALIGYPQWLVARIGHPVTWIGKLIAFTEETWNATALSFRWRRTNGVLALVVVLLVALSVAVLISEAATYLPAIAGFLIVAILASTLLAQRSLDQHVRAVADALNRDNIEEARQAVAHIVGRDTKNLDRPAIARASIESLAENFSDGVVAPAFWIAALGLPGGVLYKTINTADSMIGHKSDRYLAFGWAAARLDDLINLPASRLAALFFVAAAAILPEGNWREAWRIVVRDAKKHTSPNAGWPEAAMAGALSFKLNGPRVYDGKTVDGAWTGDGRSNLLSGDVTAALKLYRVACLVQFAFYALLALIIWLAT